MSNRIFSWVTYFAVLCIVVSENTSFITKCKQDDGDCYKLNAENIKGKFIKGWPEYNVQTMDPLKIDEIDVNDGNFHLKLTDVTVTGLQNCEIRKIVRNPSKETLTVSILTEVNLESNYNIKGKLSIFPIEGEDKFHVKIGKVQINVEAQMPEFVGKDGKRHWKITSWTENFEIFGNTVIKFDNLFKGNKALSDPVSKFISENGNILIQDLGNPVVNALIAKIAKGATNFLKKMSIEDISV